MREAAVVSVLAPGAAIERLAAAHQILRAIDTESEIPVRVQGELATLMEDIEAALG